MCASGLARVVSGVCVCGGELWQLGARVPAPGMPARGSGPAGFPSDPGAREVESRSQLLVTQPLCHQLNIDLSPLLMEGANGIFGAGDFCTQELVRDPVRPWPRPCTSHLVCRADRERTVGCNGELGALSSHRPGGLQTPFECLFTVREVSSEPQSLKATRPLPSAHLQSGAACGLGASSRILAVQLPAMQHWCAGCFCSRGSSGQGGCPVLGCTAGLGHLCARGCSPQFVYLTSGGLWCRKEFVLTGRDCNVGSPV